jgi:hypothetical protein
MQRVAMQGRPDAVVLHLQSLGFPQRASPPSCKVTYEGDDVYSVRTTGEVADHFRTSCDGDAQLPWQHLSARGERLRFLSRDATAAYLALVLGERSCLDCRLFHYANFRGAHLANWQSCDVETLRRLLLVLRDARRP